MLMADSDPDSESSSKSELLGLKHIGSSLFSLPGFFVGFGAKGSSECDAGRSPTSPLDFGVFSNLSNLFSPRSPVRSPFQNGHQNKWDCSKVGLSIVHSLANETELSNGDVDNSRRRENVVLGPQIKIKIPESSRPYGDELLDPSLKSNSVPKNYMPSFLSDASHCPQLSDSKAVFDDEGIQLEPNSLTKPGSSPVNIIADNKFSRSLSAHEMTLSEDYTCIISHGPNPKTTHIFGDCILECDLNELAKIDGESRPKIPEENSPPNFSDDLASDCYSCKKKLKEDNNNNIPRGERAFCSFGCQISAEEETGNDGNISLGSSPGSSNYEDIFPLVMPLIS